MRQIRRGETFENMFLPEEDEDFDSFLDEEEEMPEESEDPKADESEEDEGEEEWEEE